MRSNKIDNSLSIERLRKQGLLGLEHTIVRPYFSLLERFLAKDLIICQIPSRYMTNLRLDDLKIWLTTLVASNLRNIDDSNDKI